MLIKVLAKKLLRGFVVMNAGVFMATSAFAASTIWVPADGNVQTAFTTTGMLAMFDDDDGATGSETTITGTPLVLAAFDLVTFAADVPDFDATNLANSSIPLTDTKQFVLGFSVDGGTTWLADDDITDHGNNTFTVNFQNEGQTYLIDVEIVTPPDPVPVPAAVWLFGSGLIGLVGIARKRRSV